LEAVQLGWDELEALRLADLEGLYQEAAAEQMGVSRPTFGRLLEQARFKVADALLGSKMLVFEGGNIMVHTMRLFECADCGRRIEAACGTGRPDECPACHGTNVHRAAEEGPGMGGGGGGGGGGRGRGRCRRARWGQRRRFRGIIPLGPEPESIGAAPGDKPETMNDAQSPNDETNKEIQ
jgi:predicted DNA-binding protein (UPF0251 family)